MVEPLNKLELDRKWQRVQECKNTVLVICVPQLKVYLVDQVSLTEYEKPLQWDMGDKIQVVAYLMGDASVLGFGSVIWCQYHLVL